MDWYVNYADLVERRFNDLRVNVLQDGWQHPDAIESTDRYFRMVHVFLRYTASRRPNLYTISNGEMQNQMRLLRDLV
jgi:hypothetical protein